MAGLAAAIHVFGAVSKVVDGRDAPGHDVEKHQSPNTKLTGQPCARHGHDVERVAESASRR
jgi:uncharacterized Zn-binding protein involved in type VI secretion